MGGGAATKGGRIWRQYWQLVLVASGCLGNGSSELHLAELN